eukprot:gene470-1878_t
MPSIRQRGTRIPSGDILKPCPRLCCPLYEKRQRIVSKSNDRGYKSTFRASPLSNYAAVTAWGTPSVLKITAQILWTLIVVSLPVPPAPTKASSQPGQATQPTQRQLATDATSPLGSLHARSLLAPRSLARTPASARSPALRSPASVGFAISARSPPASSLRSLRSLASLAFARLLSLALSIASLARFARSPPLARSSLAFARSHTARSLLVLARSLCSLGNKLLARSSLARCSLALARRSLARIARSLARSLVARSLSSLARSLARSLLLVARSLRRSLALSLARSLALARSLVLSRGLALSRLARLAARSLYLALAALRYARARFEDHPWSSPEHAIPMLKALGVRHLSLANNHILDYSTQGMEDTCAHLDKAEISHCGCGPDLSAAMQMSELHPQPGWKLGFLSAADHEQVWAAKPLSELKLEKNATAGIWWIDIENGRPWSDVMEHVHRQAQLVDVLVFSVHWGPNYREFPSPAFRDFAHALIDHGVRIVHGHSANHVQPVELYHDGLIPYSCGDFLDDYAVDPFFRNDLACILRIHCDPRSAAVTRFDVIPTKIGRLQVSKASLASERSFVHRRIEGCRIEGLGFSEAKEN